MKNKLGQYFTKNIDLKERLFNLILNNPDTILEPSIGRGDLIEYISNKNLKIEFDMYEIDKNIILLECIDKNKIIYGDFLEYNIKKKYKTIIGNPPYIKKKNGNIYLDFINKCYELLEDNGELIFIVPSDFFKLTKSSKLLENMIQNGSFTHIYHPHNEKLFENATIDILIFRYLKNNLIEKIVKYNNENLFIINNSGLITFNKNKLSEKFNFKDYFNIYVGIVSGKDKIYKNNKIGNINVLVGNNNIEKFIYIKEFPSNNKEINKFLLENKKELLERKIKKFNEKNWFEWGAPRNIKTIENNLEKDCIYIYNLSRKENIAFKGKVNYFSGNLIMLLPKKNINLDNIINYLNSYEFKKNFIFSNRFKIGHRQISNSYIPNNLI